MTRADRGGTTRLRAARAVLQRRTTVVARGDVPYRLYLGVMLSLTVAAPLLRVLVLGAADAMRQPVGPGLGVFGVVGSGGVAAAGLTLLTALAVLAGSHGGPARAGLAELDLLFPAPISRVRLFAAPLGRGFLAGAAVGVLAGGVLAVARAITSTLELEFGVALVLAGGSLGVLVVGAMLLGQLGRGVRAWVSVALAGLAAVQLWVGGLFDPWSVAVRLVITDPVWGAESLGRRDFALLVGGAAEPLAFATVPVISALVVGLLAPMIAARLRRDALREQAARWDTVIVLAGSGDPNAALAKLGAPVRLGRRLRLRDWRGSLWASVARRDLLGIVRSPARSLAAFLGMLGAGVLWGAALVLGGAGGSGVVVSPGRAALLGGAALLLSVFAIIPWCRGIATASFGSGTSPLFPASAAGMLARHALVPGLLTTVALACGVLVWRVGLWGSVGLANPGAAALGSALLGTDPWSSLSAILSVLGLATATVLLRILAALKGSIPIRLLAPVPTAAGDMAGVSVALWMFDGPVVAGLAGAALGLLWRLGVTPDGSVGGLLVAALGSALLAGVLLLWVRARLRPEM